MKKSFKSISLFSAYLGIAVVMGCAKKNTDPTPANCSANSQKVIDAAGAYAKNETKANCEAYKNTVRDFYKSCASYYAAGDKQGLDEFLAEPCPN